MSIAEVASADYSHKGGRGYWNRYSKGVVRLTLRQIRKVFTRERIIYREWDFFVQDGGVLEFTLNVNQIYSVFITPKWNENYAHSNRILFIAYIQGVVS